MHTHPRHISPASNTHKTPSTHQIRDPLLPSLSFSWDLATSGSLWHCLYLHNVLIGVGLGSAMAFQTHLLISISLIFVLCFGRTCMYICRDRYPKYYIQYGSTPIRDSSPHPTPCPPSPLCGRPPHGVGWGGGEPLMDISPSWILDNGYLFMYRKFCEWSFRCEI